MFPLRAESVSVRFSMTHPPGLTTLTLILVIGAGQQSVLKTPPIFLTAIPLFMRGWFFGFGCPKYS